MIRIPLFAVLLLAFQDPAPKPAEEVRHPWGGFGPGSYAIRRTKRTDDGRATERVEKWIIGSLDKGLPAVETFVKSGERWVRGQADVPHPAPMLPTEGLTAGTARTEEIELGGRKLRCTITEYSAGDGRKSMLARGRMWTCAELKAPYRELEKDGQDLALMPDLLRLEMSLEFGRDRFSYETRIAGAGEKVKVGDHEVLCVLEEVTLEERRHPITEKWTAKRWLSGEVPGHVVKLSLSGTLRDKPFAVEQDVVEYGRK